MQVGVLMLWVSWWMCTCSSTKVQLQDICGSEAGGEKDQRSRVREHGRHVNKHQHVYVRSGTHRRKVVRVHAEDTPPRIVHHPSDVVVKAGNPATLSCRADGNPKPSIQWLRNGRALDSAKLDGHLKPLVLPEGSLFFLSVQGGGAYQSHEGIYACVATNSLGKAVSHNASLFTAVLQEEFRVQPSDVVVAEGEVAVLNCTPPLGRPEPNVLWRWNGVRIDATDQHSTELNGNLLIAPVEKHHSGSYVCEAFNTEGVKHSRAARLSVLVRPVLLIRPENVSVRLGDSAHFYCHAKGDPPPTVVWSRGRGPLPNGRYLVNLDQTLQIHYVTSMDAGSYTCTAINDAGVVSASAQLMVEESSSSNQRDLHRELSALRVILDNVTISSSGSNMSLIQWKLLSLPAQPHYLDGFEVLYRSVLPTISDWTPNNISTGFQSTVGPLHRGYQYEFKVRPYGSGLYGRESNTRHLRVPETVPSAAPQDVTITVIHQHNNTIHLTWEPLPHQSVNGITKGYQVWCMDSSEKLYQNWTVDSNQHSLDIFNLRSGTRYWLSVAAVNGAGVGVLSDPHGFIINPQLGDHLPPSGGQNQDQDRSTFWALFQDPVLIGSISALLWCVVMVAGVCLYRRYSRTNNLLSRRNRIKGLHRLASEDLIIKHRMVAPDSPWISGSWRPTFNQKYQDFWSHSQNHPGLRSTSLPVSSLKDSSFLSSVPSVNDSCGVYGTFYVDLRANGLKTFNSPGLRPKASHSLPDQHGCETIQILTQPVCTSPSISTRQALPWKQALRPQPRMGVLGEPWQKNSKQELHAVSSVPLLTSTNHSQRHSIPARPHDCCKDSGCPRLLHYSASLHLMDMLPPPPSSPPEDDHSFSSDEGSSRSTKLTVDMGSLQSVCPSSGPQGPPGAVCKPGSSSSRGLSAVLQDALTTQNASEYLELSPKAERHSILPQPRPSQPHHFGHALNYLCEPGPAPLLEEEEYDDSADEGDPPLMLLHHARLQATPSSCYSEWDGSLWNSWSSVMDSDHGNSARTSLISSLDDSSYYYTNDSRSLARLMEGGRSTSGASMSDISPPASPLSAFYPSFHPERDSFGDLEPVPVWDWSSSWMEEMEVQYRLEHLSKTSRTSRPVDT
ncbi:roundabout homolog 1 isoform X2 [Gouania willdenowi]|uniref:roundabout homolog 1 isoform X2 n=1 Tax=Gouania willdenowi TaxID=441366 RepID=UPI0010546548|nr:roundabout homolog 4 isoform X2 [Gouania willdenowi]